MSRTKIRTWVFRDPLMRKAHAHSVRTKEPDMDEELDEWLEEQYHNAQQNDDDKESTNGS